VGAGNPLFEIELDLAPKGSRESSRRLHGQLKAAILDGRLKSGTKMPPTRKSEDYFGVSRNTLVLVYERLLTEGFLATRHGSGTYVADKIAIPAERTAPSNPKTSSHRLNAFWLRPDVGAALNFWQDRPEHPSASSPSSLQVDFRPALIDSALFPFNVFRSVSAKQLRALEKKPARRRSPQGNQGNYYLREAITKHIALTRAVVCDPDDIIVTSGAQQAFDLLARVLVTANETVVAVEDPGYPPMRVAFAAAGAKLSATAVDAEGLMAQQLAPDADVICVCPSHQFPLGVTMSKRRRGALIEFARSRGAVVIEDDYDGEFRYEGSPLAALRTLAHADVVFYVGTFSKCMLPALRLGYIVAPRWAMQPLIVAKNCLDWHCPTPIQAGVSRFITDGHLLRHVRKMRHIYGKRRQLLRKSLQDDFGKWLQPIPSLYGMHVAALARTPMDLDSVAARLLQQNVKVHTLGRYFLGAATSAGFVFGYGAVDAAEINHGLSLLRHALQKYG
jgi:GntR family transcriptional regulator / MocR family aminotransferase